MPPPKRSTPYPFILWTLVTKLIENQISNLLVLVTRVQVALEYQKALELCYKKQLAQEGARLWELSTT